jgi:protein SCO1/2
MRYSMRASLKANYTADNLGFRCAGRAMRLRVLFGAALAALALGVAATRAHDHAQGGMATITAAPTGASIYNLDSTWTSQDGTSVPLDAFAGKPVVAAMGYTSCRGLCPAIVADMMWIDGRLPLALPTG